MNQHTVKNDLLPMDHCCSDGESLIFYNTRSGEKEFFKRKLTGKSGTANDYL